MSLADASGYLSMTLAVPVGPDEWVLDCAVRSRWLRQKRYLCLLDLMLVAVPCPVSLSVW